MFVGDDGAVGFDTQFFKAKSRQSGAAANRDDQGVEGDALLFAICRQDQTFLAVDQLAADRIMAGRYFDARALLRFESELCDFIIFPRQQTVSPFDLHDLGTEPGKSLAQFTTNRAAAEDNHAFGNVVHLAEFFPQGVAGYIANIFKTGEIGYKGPAAGSDHNGTRGQPLCLAIFALDFDRPWIDDRCIALHHIDPETGIALNAVMGLNGGNDIFHALHNRLEAIFGLDLVQSVNVPVAHLLGDFRAFDQRLAGYAAVVKAITAHFGTFNKRHLGLHRCGNIGRDQTGGASSDDHQISVIFSRLGPARIDFSPLHCRHDPFPDPGSDAERSERKQQSR